VTEFWHFGQANVVSLPPFLNTCIEQRIRSVSIVANPVKSTL